ncbi:CdaR family transcriptional regulator [Staphylococcus succinus]|uniref:CdaR family transcriptional regulator n=1 Tax=Staphylococcus succinus TaxID=61015 RepID=UPI000E699D82|nr:sugar diacid recognition domain-containing protein [Staphylococcus succinus]RIN29408.1 transcriptional regulator [Staphylococcus succinus]
MDVLTADIAALIVDETVKRTQHNINIMNFNGEILASYDKSRIGKRHEGACMVIEEGRTMVFSDTESEGMQGTQAGVNLPIIFQDNIVGVIGITGDPKALEQIADLVKMSTELLLYQNYFTYELEGNIRSQELLVEELLKSEPSKSFIQYLTQQLNTQLYTFRKCIIVNIEKQIFSKNSIVRTLASQLETQSFIIAFTNSNRIVILITGEVQHELDFKVKSIYQIFKRLKLDIQMASSLVFKHLKDFKNAYEECELVFMLNEHNQPLMSFEDVEEKTLLYQIDKEIRERYKKRVLGSLDLQSIETLKHFFKNDLNIAKTAKYLYIHRNTLLYRLEKCEAITGLNPKKYADALKLQIALWC